MRRIILVLMFLPAPAFADATEDNVRKAIIQMGTAHLCAPIMDDSGPYEWTRRNLIDLVGDEHAEELIAVMQDQDRDPGPLNERMCRNMTKNYRD